MKGTESAYYGDVKPDFTREKGRKSVSLKVVRLLFGLFVFVLLPLLLGCGGGGSSSGGGGGGGSSLPADAIRMQIVVHVDEAVEWEIDDALTVVQAKLEENNIKPSNLEKFIEFNQELLNREKNPYKQLSNIDEATPYIEVTLPDSAQFEDVQDLMQRRFDLGGEWSVGLRGKAVRLTLSKEAIGLIRRQTLENVRSALSYRIEKLGIFEPAVMIQGDDVTSQRILIELPGVEDSQEVIARIQTPGQLEYRLVVYDDNDIPYMADTKEELVAMFKLGIIPPGAEVVPLYSKTASEAGRRERTPDKWYLLHRAAVVDGRYMQHVKAEPSEYTQGWWVIHFKLNEEGGERMRTATRNNIDKLLAIVLDKEAIFVGSIKSELGSESQIEGGYTRDQAERLAWLLSVGALPVSIHVENVKQIGIEEPAKTIFPIPEP